MLDKTINFTTKPISEFNSSDSIYTQKVISGMNTSILMQFVKFESGMVTGEILEIQPNNSKMIWIGKDLYKIGDRFSSRIKTCYTFSRLGAHWFAKDGKDYKCSEK